MQILLTLRHQSVILCTRTVILEIPQPQLHPGSPDPRPEKRDAPRSRTVQFCPFSLPSPGLSSARRSLHSRTASPGPSVPEATSVWGGGGSSLLAQNEWKPLRSRAGLNSGVQGSRVRGHHLPGHLPTNVSAPHTPHLPAPGCLPLFPGRRSALRGGDWAELAPRKGRGLALPTSQGGARRERAACPGNPCLEADGQQELLSPFPPQVVLIIAPYSSPARGGCVKERTFQGVLR